MAQLLTTVLLMMPTAGLASETGKPNYRHPGCNTHRCDRRMERKAHKRTLRRWRRVARPYAGWLERTGNCETRGLPNRGYTANTGNGFFGRYQFDFRSWLAAGGTTQYAHLAEPIEQDYRAVVWLRMVGRGAWPVCG